MSSSPGSFLLTRPDRVSAFASYKTFKVGREPQGESLARGSRVAQAECGGACGNFFKFVNPYISEPDEVQNFFSACLR